MIKPSRSWDTDYFGVVAGVEAVGNADGVADGDSLAGGVIEDSAVDLVFSRIFVVDWYDLACRSLENGMSSNRRPIVPMPPIAATATAHFVQNRI